MTGNSNPSQIVGLPVTYPATGGREQGGETQNQAQNVSFFALLKTGNKMETKRNKTRKF